MVSGRVTDPDGEGVAGVTLELYPFGNGADAEPLQTRTESDGTFRFEALAEAAAREEYVVEPDETVLIARDGDWFWTTSGDFESASTSALEITLRNQLLFGPEVAADGNDQRDELSLMTCWRQIDGTGIETLFLEVTNVRGAVDREPFEILTDSTDLDTGAFSVTVPRGEVRINFGPQTEFDDDSPPAKVLALETGSENPELADWHPIRTGVPLFGIGSGYLDVSSSDPSADSGPETVVEGVGRIVHGLPGIGTVLSVVDTVGFAVGKQLRREASLGDADVGFPDPTDPDELATVADPNTHTSALLGWNAPEETLSNTGAGSVVMMVPMALKGDGSPRAAAHAEWLHTTGRVTFGEVFELTPARPDGTSVDESVSTAEEGESVSTAEEGESANGDRATVDDYAGEDGVVDTGGLFDAAEDFGAGEIGAETLVEVATSYRPSLPFG
ncbi:carboxypeptidase-like regulatory domain-containing protein [Halobellus litoreus]|uniref:Carboxypeptidase-like regulatory domain-containing protein n=1 Tax=Halobellus litoreus TaxID=755310 RepID=A0ABD6DWU0_9EURY|nr:carboxypeptidase-like regulatory domain-containing protein [Halobellus litoreus]